MTRDPRMTVETFIEGLDGETRRLAFAEWGITVEAAGWPLDVGVAIRDGLLRAQAHVIGPDRIDPHDLLRWNRQVPFVRFAHTRDGEVWIQGDLPLVAVDPVQLDTFLGLLVLSVVQAREAAGRADGERAGDTVDDDERV
ncbi:YbjN domain-containing protein [Conexibacter sp. CPCC 206217]|uniref:YbjN domain-containing protein n=1 Tax=Conexibacter sp. CPCC 206217 TaxID=3064574 RepID=UPI002729148F|nr:YbjN domain-containing protein [Conexibacter sp. CPCC 206217]MDO8210701.1 YbjN domain-containing protein [Conexibacter sp. CPCC 206217]